MAKNPFIVIDLETGGVDETENPIMQIAYEVLDHTGRLLTEHTYNELVKPYGNLKIEEAAVNVHGISVKRAKKEGVPINVALKKLLDLCVKLNPSFRSKGRKFKLPTIVAHNAEFEMDFLAENFDNILGENFYQYVEAVPMDTLKLGRMAYPDKSTHKLGVLAKEMGIVLTDAHDAMSDVKATRAVFTELMNRVQNVSGGGQKEQEHFKYKF